MATNFIQEGDALTVTAPSGGVTSGDGVLLGVLFGVASHTAAAGDPVTIVTKGVFSLPKTSAQAWTVGAAIYWDDDGDGATTATTAGNVLIGVAAAAAGNPTPTGVVRLNGSSPAAATA